MLHKFFSNWLLRVARGEYFSCVVFFAVLGILLVAILSTIRPVSQFLWFGAPVTSSILFTWITRSIVR